MLFSRAIKKLLFSLPEQLEEEPRGNWLRGWIMGVKTVVVVLCFISVKPFIC